MKYSIINFTKLNEELRIDSDFFKPEYLKIYNTLIKLGNVRSFGTLTDEIKCGPFGSTILNSTYTKSGITVARPFNISNYKLGDEDIVYISKEDFVSKRLTSFHNGDILFSRVGDVRVGIVPYTYDTITISPNVIGVKVNKKKVSSYYATIFFNTQYGLKQIEREQKIVAQPTIPTALVNRLKIPLATTDFQKLIEKIFIDSITKEIKLTKLYESAERVLIEELELKDWHPKNKLSNIKSFKEVENSKRFDAEYFQSKYDELKEIVFKYSTKTLGDEFQLLSGKNFKYVDDGTVGVVKTKQVINTNVNYENIESTTSKDVVNESKLFTLEDRDVLFASMGVGSLGRSCIAYAFETKDLNDYTIDSTLYIFRQKKDSNLTPEVLDIYLSSVIGQELIYQNIVGSSGIINIYRDYISSIPIPDKISRKAADTITQLIRESHMNRLRSKKLLEIAKKGVEMAIEENEKSAEEWIKYELNKLQITI